MPRGLRPQAIGRLRAHGRPVVVGVVVGVVHRRQRLTAVQQRAVQRIPQLREGRVLIVIGRIGGQLIPQHPRRAGHDQRRAALAAVGVEQRADIPGVLIQPCPVEAVVRDLSEIAAIRAQIGAADVLLALRPL